MAEPMCGMKAEVVVDLGAEGPSHDLQGTGLPCVAEGRRRVYERWRVHHREPARRHEKAGSCGRRGAMV